MLLTMIDRTGNVLQCIDGDPPFPVEIILFYDTYVHTSLIHDRLSLVKGNAHTFLSWIVGYKG